MYKLLHSWTKKHHCKQFTHVADSPKHTARFCERDIWTRTTFSGSFPRFSASSAANKEAAIAKPTPTPIVPKVPASSLRKNPPGISPHRMQRSNSNALTSTVTSMQTRAYRDGKTTLELMSTQCNYKGWFLQYIWTGLLFLCTCAWAWSWESWCDWCPWCSRLRLWPNNRGECAGLWRQTSRSSSSARTCRLPSPAKNGCCDQTKGEVLCDSPQHIAYAGRR